MLFRSWRLYNLVNLHLSPPAPLSPSGLSTGRQLAGARVPNGAQGAQPRGAGGRHTPHAGERPRRGPEASTLTHLTFSRARKKGPHGPFGFLVLMTRRRGPATFDSAPRARRCARSTAPTRTTPPTPPPGSYPRHAGPAAPLHPGTSRDSSTHMGCRPYPLNTPR